MRIILQFSSFIEIQYNDINKYDIQGFIYSLLKGTEFENYHDLKGFKFFNFSNIFPINNFKCDERKTLIISSPNSAFIKILYYQLSKLDAFRLNKYYMKIINVKLIKKTKCSNSIITGTPIVLFENNVENRYLSFKNSFNFDFFFERLKENAVKKYNAFTGINFELTSELFSSFEFNREVSIRISIRNNRFILIGSLWKSLEKHICNEDKDFYNFLFDAGLGEKNSLGCGFLNNKGGEKQC